MLFIKPKNCTLPFEIINFAKEFEKSRMKYINTQIKTVYSIWIFYLFQFTKRKNSSMYATFILIVINQFLLANKIRWPKLKLQKCRRENDFTSDVSLVIVRVLNSTKFTIYLTYKYIQYCEKKNDFYSIFVGRFNLDKIQ